MAKYVTFYDEFYLNLKFVEDFGTIHTYFQNMSKIILIIIEKLLFGNDHNINYHYG